MSLEILHCLCSWLLGWAMLIDGLIRVVSFGLMRPGLGFMLSQYILESEFFPKEAD